MASQPSGILGPITGKIGTVIGGTWRGKSYLRSRPQRSADYVPSPAQQAQQQRFKLAVSFAQALSDLLKVSFEPMAIQKTAKNCAVSYFMKQAIEGTAPDFYINYSKVIISPGDLPGAEDATALPDGAGGVRFRWKSNGGDGRARNNDRAIIAIYCPELNESVYHTAAAYRSREEATLNAVKFIGKSVHTWIGFMSEDGKLVATSVYTSEMVIV